MNDNYGYLKTYRPPMPSDGTCAICRKPIPIDCGCYCDLCDRTVCPKHARLCSVCLEWTCYECGVVRDGDFVCVKCDDEA